MPLIEDINSAEISLVSAFLFAHKTKRFSKRNVFVILNSYNCNDKMKGVKNGTEIIRG